MRPSFWTSRPSSTIPMLLNFTLTTKIFGPVWLLSSQPLWKMYISIIITLIWTIIFIIDNFLEHKLGFRYISYKFQKEIVLKPFYFSWQNCKISNKLFYDYNFNLKSKKYNHWFNCGIFSSIVLCLYGYSLFIPPVWEFFGENKILEYCGWREIWALFLFFLRVYLIFQYRSEAFSSLDLMNKCQNF